MSKSPTKNEGRKAAKFKPLLFTTTMRNSERLQEFLRVLRGHEGEVLSNDLCIQIEGELIRKGLYRPMRTSAAVKAKWETDEELSDIEVQEILDANPQQHKEAGFARGWPSRFHTHYMLARDFGCAFYEIGEKIEFSEVGKFCCTDTTGAWQQAVHLNALSKYHRNNPFKRVLNHNRPLALLLGALLELQRINGPNDPGIARHELTFVGVWRDANATELAEFICEFRKKFGASPSDEIIFEACEKVLGGWHASCSVATITRDLPDEFLRKLRLTGLFVLRGGGRYLSLSSHASSKIERVMVGHSSVLDFDTEREYFDFVAAHDPELVTLESFAQDTQQTSSENLTNWINQLGMDVIRENLLILSRGKATSHEILRLLDQPLRLEFLSALLVAGARSDLAVKPNYRSDDEGLPLSCAPGGMPDILIQLGDEVLTLEVTLMRGRQQVHNEMIPIERHIKDLGTDQAVFVAPVIHDDARRYADWVLHDSNLRISTHSISDFADEPGAIIASALM